MEMRRKGMAAVAAFLLLGAPACDGDGEPPEVETGREAGDPGEGPGTQSSEEEIQDIQESLSPSP